MTKKISVVLAIIMLLACVFAACGEKNNEENPLVGIWKNDAEVVYCFNADGTGYYEVMGFAVDFTYDVKDKEIIMEIDSTSMIEEMFGMTVDELLEGGYVSESDLDELKYTETFEYSLDGDVLTIDGVECVREK